jgi:zinc resistance-associated protein
MWKKLAVSLIAFTVAGTSLVWSQTPPAQGSAQQPAAGSPAAPSNTPTPEDVAALSDARLAALKIGLKLKPDQEKNWTSFETTIRDLAKQRQERFAQFVKDRQNPPKAPAAGPGDVLRIRAKSMTQAAGDLTRYADAIDPLYKTLDDDQKRRMLVLMTALTPRR